MREILISLLEKKYIRFLLLVLSGSLTGLTLIFTELWLLEWVSFLPMGLVILSLGKEKHRLCHLYGYGLIFFWSLYAVALHWFVSMYPLSFTGLGKGEALAVVFLGVFGLSFLQALFSAFSFVFYGLLARTPLLRRFSFLHPFVFAALYTLAEWFQNFGFWGVPWGRLGIGQTGALIMLQTASLFGSYFITFLLVLSGLLLSHLLLYGNCRRAAAGTVLSLFLFQAALGTVLYFTDREEEGKEPIRVAALQGNISNKWEVDTMEVTSATYRRLALAAAEDGAELIVLPETAFPVYLTHSAAYRNELSALARECNATLLVGALRAVGQPDAYTEYNSVYVISPDGSFSDITYDKQQLVPFGEFVPMRDLVMTLVPMLNDIGMLDSDLTPGDRGQTLDTPVGVIGSLICFDSIYENAVLSEVKNGAELLALSSNDAWFLDSAAIYMHHHQARMRAVETGRYLVRSGNSGITSLISPRGEVLTSIDPLIEGYVTGEVYLRTAPTLYTRIGNLFVALLVLFLLILLAIPSVFFLRSYYRDRAKGEKRKKQLENNISFALLILAALAFSYGALASRYAQNYIWYCLSLLLAGYAGIVLFLNRGSKSEQQERRKRMLKKICHGGILLFSAYLLTVEGFVLSGMQAKGEKGLDYIIVLGAKVNGESPSQALSERIKTAAAYLEENPKTLAVLSGGKGSDENISEAECMYRELLAYGIAQDRLILEEHSTSTSENILYSYALIPDGKKVGIITNNFHITRAVKLARSIGNHEVVGIAAAFPSVALPHYLFRECFAITSDLFKGNINLFRS